MQILAHLLYFNICKFTPHIICSSDTRSASSINLIASAGSQCPQHDGVRN